MPPWRLAASYQDSGQSMLADGAVCRVRYLRPSSDNLLGQLLATNRFRLSFTQPQLVEKATFVLDPVDTLRTPELEELLPPVHILLPQDVRVMQTTESDKVDVATTASPVCEEGTRVDEGNDGGSLAIRHQLPEENVVDEVGGQVTDVTAGLRRARHGGLAGSRCVEELCLWRGRVI